MPIISVRIPQLGEGLQEALLVEFLKKPGDKVRRDEPIYVMETDKATTDVESPYEGELIEWTVDAGSVLQIGCEIARMQVAEGVKEMSAGHGPAGATVATTAPAPTSAPVSTATAIKRASVVVPPRTRKYLKEKGLLAVVDQIPADGSKLMPEDVDRYLAAQQNGAGQGQVPAADFDVSESSEEFEQIALPQSQIVLNYRLTRGTQVCVPVTVMNEMDWSSIEENRASVRDSGGPTGFAMCCWCVVQAMKRHAKFRSALNGDGKSLKVFRHINLGVAVAMPKDEMVTAVVRGADGMDQPAFFTAFSEQVNQARNGNDQADQSTTMTVSNIGKAGMRMGIPAIVAPAVATLAIGETYDQPIPKEGGFEFRRRAMATLCFDHRIANGVGAANFMADIKQAVEGFKLK